MKKITAWILRALSIIAILGVAGSAGACELDIISGTQMIVQGVIFLALGLILIAISERLDGDAE